MKRYPYAAWSMHTTNKLEEASSGNNRGIRIWRGILWYCTGWMISFSYRKWWIGRWDGRLIIWWRNTVGESSICIHIDSIAMRDYRTIWMNTWDVLRGLWSGRRKSELSESFQWIHSRNPLERLELREEEWEDAYCFVSNWWASNEFELSMIDSKKTSGMERRKIRREIIDCQW